MSTKTFAQLTAETTVEDTDLLATWRGSGPLKRLNASIFKTYVQPVGVFLADGSVPMTGALPAIAGSVSLPGVSIVGDTNTGLYSPGGDQIALSAGGSQRVFASATTAGYFKQLLSKSGAYTILRADACSLIECTGTFTLTADAAANLAGVGVLIRNVGTGVITFDPSGSETVNGRTSIAIYPGEGFGLECDGTGFYTIGRASQVSLYNTTTAGTPGLIEITTGLADDEFTAYRATYNFQGASGGTTPLIELRFSGSYSSNHACGYTSNGVFTNTSGAAGITLYSANNTCAGVLDIVQVSPAASARGPAVAYSSAGAAANTYVVGNGGVTGVTSRTLDGIRFLYDAGGAMIAGVNIKLWGIR